ncbi:MAG: hypothetical protein HUK08_03015 [Bacteroidaceae bacterium]|nr:hypothetical protein [Bacteroidaceae bacterium]
MKNLLAIISTILLCATPVLAQDDDTDIADTAKYCLSIEGQASFSKGKTPLWLNANKYGLSSLKQYNGYLRASLIRRMHTPEDEYPKKLDYGFGVDLAVGYGNQSVFVIQQAYLEGRWLKGVLTIGAKEYPLELKSNELSSGSQTLGKNARPIPQVRLELGEFWAIPYTKGMVSVKAHIAYGLQTDQRWQREFTNMQSKYSENVLFHSKAGYLRFGNEFSRVHFTIGCEMATLFGGTSYVDLPNGKIVKIENDASFKAFWNAFVPTSSEGEVTETTYKNVAGDMLGSWVARLDYENDRWKAGLYIDHFFEDHSQMFFMDYDGYGTGAEWNVKKERKYFGYKFKDMMLGFDFKKRNNSWFDALTAEFIYTKYQSGPIYHDHTETIADHIGGNDDYYNHYILPGWQHWGQVMGNPLYLSPVYNEDGRIEVENNRFVAYHLGISGHPTDRLAYKVLATYQDGMGTYTRPYDGYKKSFNLLLEASYQFPKHWLLTAAFGLDRGNIHGNNTGAQITIKKSFYK